MQGRGVRVWFSVRFRVQRRWTLVLALISVRVRVRGRVRVWVSVRFRVQRRWTLVLALIWVRVRVRGRVRVWVSVRFGVQRRWTLVLASQAAFSGSPQGLFVGPVSACDSLLVMNVIYDWDCVVLDGLVVIFVIVIVVVESPLQ